MYNVCIFVYIHNKKTPKTPEMCRNVMEFKLLHLLLSSFVLTSCRKHSYRAPIFRTRMYVRFQMHQLCSVSSSILCHVGRGRSSASPGHKQIFHSSSSVPLPFSSGAVRTGLNLFTNELLCVLVPLSLLFPFSACLIVCVYPTHTDVLKNMQSIRGGRKDIIFSFSVFFKHIQELYNSFIKKLL